MSELALRLIEENKRTGATFLDLSNCSLRVLPKELFELKWLVELNIGNREGVQWIGIRVVGPANRVAAHSLEGLSQLTQLQLLNLRSNRIKNYRFLEKLTQLQSLDLSDNWIKEIGFLEKLTQLQSLNLRYNKIKEIGVLEDLTQLQSLDLHSNQIKEIRAPEKLTQLQSLNLSYNQIKKIGSLEKLTQLQSLDLSYNRLKEIEFLEDLTQLQSLDLHSNQIKEIRFLEKLTQLQSLDLRHNRLKEIEALEKLTQLQSLDLSLNQIQEIEALEKLTQLQSLDLSHNQIQEIEALEKLTQLQSLDLSHNQIQDIRSLGTLIQLQTLNLRSNQIREFPEQLIQAWPSLHSLYLSGFTVDGNPIENIPKEHFDGYDQNSISAIRGYFASLQQGSLKNDEVKLIVVGNTTAGKTSLMQFLREGSYELTQNSTHGIALTHWSVTDSPLRANVWDFGGQEYYHATHRLFLDDHAVYIVLWEASTNTEQILITDIYLSGTEYKLPLEHFSYSYWLNSIRYYAPKSTILLVQNKIDKTGVQNVPDDYFKPDYSVQSPAYHLSVYQANEYKDNPSKPAWTAFQDFKANLITTLQTDAAGHELGMGWIAIRDAIRQLSETQRWMTYTEFEHFCQQAVAAVTPPVKFDSAVEMSALLTYLGGAASTIVYYADDTRLRDKVFLNPQWVTDTIYDILNYKIREKKDNPGEFTRTDAGQVLHEKGIGELTDTFLELMKKDQFELIFEKPNCPDEYITPQYLPDTHGEKDVQRYRRRTQHSFTLYFPRFMPRSVFLRFMVRYGNLATEVYWKYGIVLERSEIDILAECMFAERKIRVSIEENYKNPLARELFEGLWRLSDRKPEVEVSVNEKDFVPIGELEEYINQVPRIRSKQGNWLDVNDFFYLFGKESSPESKTPPTEMPEPITPEIFFSYAWGDDQETTESREKIVDELYESLKNDGYPAIRDKMDLGYKGLISKFIRRIGKGNIVIVAISDKYLKSPYCMFELLEIYRNARLEKDEFTKVVFPIRVESIALNKPAVQSDYFDYWYEREKEWKELITKHGDRVKPAQFNEYDKVRNIHNYLGDLIEHLRDMNALTNELLSVDNFAKIKEIIEARIKELKR